MKGIIFNILEEFVDRSYGEGSFDKLVDEALGDSSEVFVSPETYPDEKLFSLLDKIVEIRKVDLDDVLKSFGRYMFGKLARKYPLFVQPYDNPKDFIKTVNDIIHIEVKKIFLESEPPIFLCVKESGNNMTIRYESKRNLSSLAEGLLNGVADYYKKPIRILDKKKVTEENLCIFQLEFTS
ncbi:MAG: heme NO-binding domain-containing protein [Bacteriovoracales bacterium]|nr:heme NO-binding domain-containing protein [Bacteriovoracales bacterium]